MQRFCIRCGSAMKVVKRILGGYVWECRCGRVEHVSDSGMQIPQGGK